MCLTGFGQYLFANREDVYFSMIRAHTTIGLAGSAMFLVWLFLFSHRTHKIILFFYPAAFYKLVETSSPFLTNMYILHFVLFPMSVYLLAFYNTPKQKRLRMIAAAVLLYGITFVLITGFIPITNPNVYRYGFKLRLMHAWFAPWAVLLPAFLYIPSLYRREGKTFGLKHLVFVVVLLAACIPAGKWLHSRKAAVFSSARTENRFLTPRFAEQQNLKFRKMPAALMSDDAVCEKCHPVPYRQWKVSVHANAAKTKPFQKTLRALIAKHGIGIARDCATCHDPEVAFSGDLKLIVDETHLKRSQGVSCRVCHYMSESGGKNALYVLEFPRSDFLILNGRMDMFANGKSGNVLTNFIIASNLEHVTDVSKPITKNGTMCFPCHSLESKRNGHILVPYDNVTSFKASKISKQMACHECHMPRIEMDILYYPWMDHTFFGIQQELPDTALYPEKGQVKDFEKFASQTGKWMKGKLVKVTAQEMYRWEINNTFLIDPLKKREKVVKAIHEVIGGGNHFDMELTEYKRRGSFLSLKFSTLNKNAGHDFPSALFANVSEVWFQLEVIDAKGTALYASGFHPNDLTHRLGRIEVDAEGRPIEPADSLKYVNIINKKYLEPDKKYYKTYRISINPDIRLPLKVTYTLYYRRYADSFVSWFSNGEMISVPARIVAQKEFTIKQF